jgi:hypothetical protein
MTPLDPLRLPPLRRWAPGKVLFALAVLVLALSALATAPTATAYSCPAVPQNRVYECRGPVKPAEKERMTKAKEAGRIGATPLILLLLALGGTLALPIGFDRISRRDDFGPNDLLR